MKLIPFKPEHAEGMLGNTVEPMNVSIVRSSIQAYSSSVVSFSGVNDNNKVFGSAGIIQMFPGVGLCWALFDRDLITSVPPSWIYRKTREGILKSIVDFNLHRIQADCINGSEVAEGFLRNLGFTKEGVMRKYGLDKCDHALFSIIREDL